MATGETERKRDHAPIVHGLVIVAAGRGSRAGLDSGPKQYHRLAGKAVLARTLACFLPLLERRHVCIVIHGEDHDLLAEALDGDTGGLVIVSGAETRQGSVLCGLRALAAAAPDVTHAMIHDAARPFVPQDLLQRIMSATEREPDAGILPVLPIAETVKRGDGDRLVSETVDRSALFSAQTPQTFPLGAILKLHEAAAAQGIDTLTDDSAVFEKAGLPVRMIEGDIENRKLTYARDFAMAEDKLRMALSALPDVRTGNGYDVHRFGPGDHVTLCGIMIPHDKGLTGHSDADVAMHALTDALLATCGAGDIGDHFPPSDPQWRGAASSIFLTHAASIVRAHGGTIMNADVSLVAEAPKIAPHREAMCLRLAEVLGIERQRCSVKATTNETMGFVGRREGIAAIATATVVYAQGGTRDE